MRGFFIEDAECLQFDLDSVEVSQPKLQNILKCPVRENSDLIFQAHVRSRRSPSFQVKRLENTKHASDSHHCPVGFLASCNSPPLPGSSCPPADASVALFPPPRGIRAFSSINHCRSSPVPCWFLRVPWGHPLLWWAPTVSRPASSGFSSPHQNKLDELSKKLDRAPRQLSGSQNPAPYYEG